MSPGWALARPQSLHPESNRGPSPYEGVAQPSVLCSVDHRGLIGGTMRPGVRGVVDVVGAAPTASSVWARRPAGELRVAVLPMAGVQPPALRPQGARRAVLSGVTGAGGAPGLRDGLEWMAGLEPASARRQRAALPLSYTHGDRRRDGIRTRAGLSPDRFAGGRLRLLGHSALAAEEGLEPPIYR
jgi:hypothetical protein